MADPFLCTQCSTPLDAPSASGLCAACALLSQTREEPPAAPQEPDTPPGLADGTPAGANPNPFAQTQTGPDFAPTAPTAPESELPDDPEGFMLIRRLGGGGMGDVYLAHEEVTNRQVAVKFLRRAGNTHLLERFKLEFRALANLNHPNAVDVYTYKFEGPAPFYAMELLEGGSVADRLRANGPLAAADAVELIRKVAGAVKALHEHRAHGCLAGVIHRDIKPGNILLTAGGEPKLADFGLVKYLDAETITHTLQEVGTAQYMPPEQFNRANGEVGYPSDVYSLGATLYHLLTGCAPFAGETVFEVRDAVLGADPVRVRALCPEVSLALEAVVLKCLAKDPAERYQTVAEFLKALENPELDPAPRHTRAHRAKRLMKRHTVGLALSAAVLVATAAVAVAVWPERPANEKARKALAAGRSAPLVPEKGLPPWHRWHLGAPPFGASPLQDGNCWYESIGASVLELSDDPGVDSYKVRVRIRQTARQGDAKNAQPRPDEGRIGLVWGFARTEPQPGATKPATVYTMHALAFSDFDPMAAVGQPPEKQHLSLERLAYVCYPKDVPRSVSTTFAELPFDAAVLRPGPERVLEVDVTPTAVRARWIDAAGAREVPVRGGLNPVRNYAKFQEDVDGAHPDTGFVAPAWSPRMPLGLFATRSAVSVTEVTISPLTP